jgi:hypothetical protein
MDLDAPDRIEDTEEQTGSTADAAALDLVKQLITLAAGVLALECHLHRKDRFSAPRITCNIGCVLDGVDRFRLLWASDDVSHCEESLDRQ